MTTDHISPAGDIAKTSPAAKYLVSQGVQPIDFNSYGARRGNHEVMMRGTFANIRLRNLLAPGTEGGVTVHVPTGEQMSIFDAAMRYKQDGTPLVILAGKEYGTGSSRDWAAKGTMLLGVRAVIAESFERIHRSNLIGMGVLPLMFPAGKTRRLARPHGQRSVRDHRSRQRRSQDREGGGDAAEGLTDHVRGARAHRHAEGARLLPSRRHPAVRAAAARREGGVDGNGDTRPVSSKWGRTSTVMRHRVDVRLSGARFEGGQAQGSQRAAPPGWSQPSEVPVSANAIEALSSGAQPRLTERERSERAHASAGSLASTR